jgi:hypothetical protein
MWILLSSRPLETPTETARSRSRNSHSKRSCRRSSFDYNDDDCNSNHYYLLFCTRKTWKKSSQLVLSGMDDCALYVFPKQPAKERFSHISFLAPVLVNPNSFLAVAVFSLLHLTNITCLHRNNIPLLHPWLYRTFNPYKICWMGIRGNTLRTSINIPLDDCILMLDSDFYFRINMNLRHNVFWRPYNMHRIRHSHTDWLPYVMRPIIISRARHITDRRSMHRKYDFPITCVHFPVKF